MPAKPTREELEKELDRLRQSEQELRRSEEKYRELFTRMAQGAFFQAADGTLEEVNDKALEMFGLTRDEFLGRTSLHAAWKVVREDGALLAGPDHPSMQALATGKPVTGLVGVSHPKKNDFVWMNVTAVPRFRPGEEKPFQVFATLHDVTERKKATQALRDMGEKLHLAMETAREGVWEWDLVSDAMTFDPVALDMLGYGPGDVRETGAWWFDRIHPDDQAGAAVAFDDYLSGRAADYRVEFRLRRKDGGYSWVASNARIVRRDPGSKPLVCVGIHRDITEHKAADESLRISEEKFAKAFRASPDAFFLSTVPEGRFIDVNDAGCLITGYAREEILGRSALDLGLWAYPSDRLRYLKMLREQGRVVNLEARYRTKSGGVAIGLLSGEIIELPGGPCYLSLVRDITARKRKENILAARDRLLAFSSGRTLDELMEQTLNEVEDLTASSIGFYHFVDFDRGFLTLQNWSARTKKKFCRAQGKGLHYEIAKAGVWVDCIYRQEGVIHNDYASLPNKKGLPPGHAELKREMVVPVLRGGKVKAVLGVGNKQSDYTEEDLEVIGMFADLAWEIADQKMAEEALRESEERLELVLEGSRLGLWDWNIETGEVQRNERWAEMLGYRLDDIEFTVKQWQDFIHPDDRERAMRSIEDHLQGRSPNHCIEYRMLGKDGVYRWILDQARVVRRGPDGRPRRMSGTHTDITERKRAEEELKESEELLNEVGRIALIGGWEMDLVRRKAAWTKTTYDLVGIRPGDPIPGPDEHLGYYLEEDRPRVAEAMRALAEEGKPLDFEARAEIRGKGIRWFRVLGRRTVQNGESVRLFGTIQDVTEQKLAEEELQASEERFRHFFLHLTAGVAVYDAVDDGEDFVIFDINPAGQRSSRVDIDRVRGKRLSEVFPAAGKIGLLAALRETWRTGEPRFLPLCQYKDERIAQWVENRIFRLPSGKVVALYDDRTEVVGLEERLRHAQKMEAIGRLAGGVAHDFNNMLGVILGHTELAQATVDPSEPIHEDLAEIAKAAKRSADLTRQLLAFARKQPIRPQVLDLNQTLSGMLKMLKRIIGEDIRLAWLPGDKVWPVRLDPTQLDQILANLAINSRDAIEGVGTLTVETCNVVVHKAQGGRPPGDYVLLKVADTGCGLMPQDLEHIFEPFFTTKGQGKGTGLGLATVYGIVEQNGGFITVESVQGRGATFAIHLPRAEKSTAEAPAAEENEPAGGRETILLVEDEPALLSMTRSMLERYGYRVLAARGPHEAMDLAARHEGVVHLLLTDVVMPVMNGRDLMNALSVLRPGLRALYMSGYSENVIAKRGVVEENVRYIQKPFTVRGLAAAVRKALEG